jgi:hypothetical protein
MATVMNSHSVRTATYRSSVQKVCIGMGAAFIFMGLAGMIAPSFMGMHLSLAHNLIHIASGALALWVAFADDSRKAYTFSASIGIIYALMGLAGFVMGAPGYPSVGNLDADNYLLRVVPNVLEWTSMDHTIHLLIAAVFFYGAYIWKRSNLGANGALTDVQRRARSAYGTDFRNSDTNLADADLGASDINRVTDVHRRADFEEKL